MELLIEKVESAERLWVAMCSKGLLLKPEWQLTVKQVSEYLNEQREILVSSSLPEYVSAKSRKTWPSSHFVKARGQYRVERACAFVEEYFKVDAIEYGIESRETMLCRLDSGEEREESMLDTLVSTYPAVTFTRQSPGLFLVKASTYDYEKLRSCQCFKGEVPYVECDEDLRMVMTTMTGWRSSIPLLLMEIARKSMSPIVRWIFSRHGLRKRISIFYPSGDKSLHTHSEFVPPLMKDFAKIRPVSLPGECSCDVGIYIHGVSFMASNVFVVDRDPSVSLYDNLIKLVGQVERVWEDTVLEMELVKDDTADIKHHWVMVSDVDQISEIDAALRRMMIQYDRPGVIKATVAEIEMVRDIPGVNKLHLIKNRATKPFMIGATRENRSELSYFLATEAIVSVKVSSRLYIYRAQLTQAQERSAKLNDNFIVVELEPEVFNDDALYLEVRPRYEEDVVTGYRVFVKSGAARAFGWAMRWMGVNYVHIIGNEFYAAMTCAQADHALTWKTVKLEKICDGDVTDVMFVAHPDSVDHMNAVSRVKAVELERDRFAPCITYSARVNRLQYDELKDAKVTMVMNSYGDPVPEAYKAGTLSTLIAQLFSAVQYRFPILMLLKDDKYQQAFDHNVKCMGFKCVKTHDRQYRAYVTQAQYYEISSWGNVDVIKEAEPVY